MVEFNSKEAGGEFREPLRFDLSLKSVSGIQKVDMALSEGNEVLIFGRTSDYRTPHMFHLGKYKRDIFGARYESPQQITSVVDLADYFMRYKECKAAFVQVRK